MNVRRATLVLALAATVCLLPATAAHADVALTIREPAVGTVLTGPLDVRVSHGLLDGCPTSVVVRPVTADGTVLAEPWSLQMTEGCDNYATSWQGTADLTVFSCNGEYALQAKANNSSWSARHQVILSQPPAAPTGVTVKTSPGTATTGTATVSWTAPATQDLTGYAVERRTDGKWTVIAEPAAGTTSVTDSSAPTGTVEYRVVAFRGDGKDGDAPSPACADGGRDLQATSTSTSATVPQPEPSPSPGDSESEGSEGPTEHATDEPTEGSTSGPGDGSGGSAPDDEEPAASQPSDSSTRSSARVAPPSSVGTGTRPDVDVPDVASEEPEPERYYGDDLGYSDEIDYGDLGATEASDELREDTVEIRVPGALQGAFGETLALQRVLSPVAGGMIMLAFGLHLRRWKRQGLDG